MGTIQYEKNEPKKALNLLEKANRLLVYDIYDRLNAASPKHPPTDAERRAKEEVYDACGHVQVALALLRCQLDEG